ncbi:MAG: LytR/AlgR family response regulator transcription factor, partial [Gammaproteobacteria bacterium]
MSDTPEPRLRTLIADDEPLALGMLRSILASIPGVELVAQCRNGREALTEIRRHAPDLVFLDIQMPGRNGFEVVKALQADDMPMVVFATAYDTYAIKAFELHAVDYILKPLDAERVRQSVDRAQLRRRATL